MPHPHDHAHKVSDPIMFGRAVRALLSDVFAKHEKAIAEIGASVNDGLGAFIAKIKGSSYHPEVVKVRSPFTLWTTAPSMLQHLCTTTLLFGYTSPYGLHTTSSGLQHSLWTATLPLDYSTASLFGHFITRSWPQPCANTHSTTPTCSHSLHHKK
jgi:hypothetical protein